jgi:molybdate transport system substrate-binding protein
MKIRALMALAIIAAIAGCGSTNEATSSAAATPTQPASQGVTPAPPLATPVELTVYAAASLADALDDVAAEYETLNPGLTLTISTDSSVALETKIEQGAGADVFLSADTANPQKLITGGFAADPVLIFATNQLAIIVPTDNPAGIESAADLARTGIKVIAAGDAVPITKYAKQLVDNLAKTSGYPADFAKKYAANIVSKEENVAAVVGKVALGEGDAAIVYATDAAGSNAVTSIDVPDAANVLATYGAVVIKTSKHEAEARAFLEWLHGPAGQALLDNLGFGPPSS